MAHYATTTKAFICGHCNGSKVQPCSVCGGTGRYRGGDLDSRHHVVECRHCKNGYVPCKHCGGRGVVVRQTKVLVRGSDSGGGLEGMPPPRAY